MLKLTQILSEVEFVSYEAMVKVYYSNEEAKYIGDVLRALPGVLTVTNAGGDAESGTMTFKVKVITQKSGEEAFQAFKTNATSKYSFIDNVEIGTETIEEK